MGLADPAHSLSAIRYYMFLTGNCRWRRDVHALDSTCSPLLAFLIRTQEVAIEGVKTMTGNSLTVKWKKNKRGAARFCVYSFPQFSIIEKAPGMTQNNFIDTLSRTKATGSAFSLRRNFDRSTNVASTKTNDAASKISEFQISFHNGM